MEIEDCYQEYKNIFLDDKGWLPLDGQNEDEVKIAYDKINNFIEKSFILLTRSIISGEYIEAPSINDILSNFIMMLIYWNLIHLLINPQRII